MTRILGIDPGSRITGFGVIDFRANQSFHVASGSIRVQGETLSARLRMIFEGVAAIVDQHRPEQLAIEQVFMHRNAASALKLGQARGVALVAAELRMLSVHEYTATQIKQAVTGRGRGTKEQVQHMIKVLLSLTMTPQLDEADALAAALCHAHTQATLTHIERAERSLVS